MEEIWKDIKGYEGRYQVSNLGRIKSLQYKGRKREYILKNVHRGRKYLCVSLCIDGITKLTAVHRLVAEAFIPNPENKPFVDHIDANPENCVSSNLRWCTQKENLENPISHKRRINAVIKKCATACVAIKNGTEIKFTSQAEASKTLGINRVSITHCLIGKTKTAGGYKWKYFS